MDAMPLDTTTTLAPDRVEASARALADTLDSLLGYDDEAIADALLSIGELLGGLGCRGFKADLDAHLERLEEDLLEDASPQDYSPGWGGNDPNQVFSAELQDRIAEMRAADAADWHAEADALLQRALTGESVA
jgi:hypothetical protein